MDGRRAAKRRRSYRNYLFDPEVPIPRTTKWRYDKKAKTIESSGTYDSLQSRDQL